MSRILFFVLLALVVYVVWRVVQKRQLPPGDVGAGVPRLPMVSCATCGLHIPREEAIAQEERYYCCEEHRRVTSPPRQ